MTSGSIRNRRDFFVMHAVLVHGVLTFMIAGTVLLGVGRMAKMYESLGMKLPGAVELLVLVSRIGRSYIGLVFPALVAALILDTLLIRRLNEHANPLWSFLWSAGVSVLLAFSVLLVIVLILLPFVC
jgi:hypothetical protein